jgi:hypothetical protein
VVGVDSQLGVGMGFRRRSVTSSMRNSIVNHAMADTVRRMR